MAVSNQNEESAFPIAATAKLITVTDAANQSQLTPSYIRRLLRTGQLAGVKVGEIWLTSEEALQAYLSTDRRPGPKPK